MKSCFTIVLSLFILNASAQILPFIKTQSLADSEQINELAKDLKDKRVVFLGDIIHGEANIDSLRAVLIDYLINEHGFNTIAFESGIYDLFQANKALQGGLDVYTVLNESIYNVWSGPSLRHLVETIEENKASLRLIGFDPKFSGIHTADIDLEIERLLEKNGQNYSLETLTTFQKHCTALTAWDTGKINHQEFLETWITISNLINQKGDDDSKEILIWKQILKNVKALYDLLVTDNAAQIPQQDWDVSIMNTRDSLMATNLRFYMDLYPQAKIICWGAAAHFAKSLETVSSSFLNTFKPMGTYFNNESLMIGAMGYSGRYGWSGNIQPMPDLPQNSVEYQLSTRVADAALVDLTFLADQEPLYSSVFVEGKPITGNWDHIFDWVIFVNEVTPKTVAHFQDREGQPTVIDTLEFQESNNPILPQMKRSFLIMRNEGTLIEGSIKDDSGKPIPFSSVGLKGTSYGVISDENGVFSIRVPNPKSDTLVFSNVAYQQTEISLRNQSSRLLEIVMMDKEIELPEIIISPNKTPAEEILIKAINSIQKNYITKPFSIKAFNQRWKIDTTEQSPVHFQYALEAYYPSGYQKTDSEILYNAIQSRKTVITEATDSLSYLFYTTNYLDFIGIGLTDIILNRRNSFLNEKRHRFFNFTVEDYVEGTFVIGFTCDRINTKTTRYFVNNAKEYRGKVYISSSDYAITKVETELIWYLDDLSRKTIRRLDNTQETLFFKTIVEYSNYDRKYYLSNISRFENYNDYGFSDYNYFDIEIGSKPSFENNLSNTVETDFDWEGILKKVGNKH